MARRGARQLSKFNFFTTFLHILCYLQKQFKQKKCHFSQHKLFFRVSTLYSENLLPVCKISRSFFTVYIFNRSMKNSKIPIFNKLYISGHLYDVTNSFDIPFVFAGITIVMCGIGLIIIQVFQKKLRK